MSKSKTVKCRWAHCRHKSKDVPREEAVKDGSYYYHEDCYHEKKTINEIVSIWSNDIDSLVNAGQLRGILNNLIYKKNIEPDYILYTVKLGAREGWLHYPQGLYRSLDDFKRHEEWKKNSSKKAVGDVQSALEDEEPPKTKLFGFERDRKTSARTQRQDKFERLFA